MDFTNAIISGIGFLVLFWVLRNPLGVKSFTQRRSLQYILYAFFGASFGLLGAAVILLNLDFDANFTLLIKYGFILLGCSAGAFLAYIRPSSLILTSADQKALQDLETIKENSKNVPKEIGWLIQGTLLVLVGGSLLLADQFHKIDYLLQDNGIGSEWIIKGTYLFLFCAGMYDLVKYLLSKISLLVKNS